MSRRIRAIDWGVVAVRKHIAPHETLPCAGVGVSIEEALYNGVVISALEVIEPGFFIEVVAIGAKMSLFHANIESGKCCLEAADL